MEEVVTLLLSIQQQYAEEIMAGTKTVELRKVCPKRIKIGSKVLVYVPTPVKALIGWFETDGVLEAPPDELWEHVKDKAGISEVSFYNYFKDKQIAYGMVIGKSLKLEKPIGIAQLRTNLPGFSAPLNMRMNCLLKSSKISSAIGLFKNNLPYETERK